MQAKVAIVEDNVGFAEALKQTITSDAHFLLTHSFSSAEAGMALLQQPTDLAIVDLQLPGMQGDEYIFRLKNAGITTQFVVCSVCDDDEHIFGALKAGAAGYLLKDSTAQQIITALKELYYGGAPMSPYIARRVVASF